MGSAIPPGNGGRPQQAAFIANAGRTACGQDVDKRRTGLGYRTAEFHYVYDFKRLFLNKRLVRCIGVALGFLSRA
jgi:hypothetical protein